MKSVLAVLCYILFFIPASFAQETGTINLSKGQKYIVNTTMKTTSATEMMGQTIDTKADVTSDYMIEVFNVLKDKYDLTNTLTKITMNASAMGQDMNFDSDNEEDLNGEMGKNLVGYINVPKKVEMDKSGKITILEIADTAASTNSEMDNPGSMMLEQIMGDPEQFGYGAKIAFQALPKNLKAGTSWTDSSSGEGIKKMTKYTLKEIKGNVASLLIDGTLASEMKTEMQGMEILTKTTGKFNGEQEVDLKSGVIKGSTVNTEATGTVTIMGQEVPNTSKIVATTSVKLM
ncbi:hypothetical protein BH20BAC1_BH20BAC1_10860 [soil metagenome]